MTPRRRIASHWLLAKRGGWRMDCIVRLYGWATVQHTLQAQVVDPLIYLRSIPLDYHLFSVASLLLLVFGCRIASLAAATGTFAWFLANVIDGSRARWEVSGYFLSFIADEFLLYLVVPGLALVCIAAGARRERTAGAYADAVADDTFAACCRVLVVGGMAFAALHKMNEDFFDPAVSCMSLHARLARWWDVPGIEITEGVRAVHVVLVEALSPAVLLVSPVVGMLYTLAMLQPFAHIGPGAFAGTVIATSLGFLRAEDERVVRPFLRRAWPWLAAAWIVLLPLSWRAYRGELPWLPFFTFDAVALGVAASLVALLVSRLREDGRSLLRGPLSGIGASCLAAIPLAVAVLLLVNNMTPYLGAKYRLSFAMLSNLRADSGRWNHWIFPRWLHLPAHDPFLRVTEVRITDREGRLRPPPRREVRDGGVLTVGTFAPYSFARRVDGHRRGGDEFDVSFTYRGAPYRFERALSDDAFGAFVDALPARRLFQAKLSLDGPQRCVH